MFEDWFGWSHSFSNRPMRTSMYYSQIGHLFLECFFFIDYFPISLPSPHLSDQTVFVIETEYYCSFLQERDNFEKKEKVDIQSQTWLWKKQQESNKKEQVNIQSLKFEYDKKEEELKYDFEEKEKRMEERNSELEEKLKEQEKKQIEIEEILTKLLKK